MKKLMLSFVLICASSFSSAHEIKELKVTRMWESESGNILYWMIADTVVSRRTRSISCSGFNQDWEPLFQTIFPTRPFSTQGHYYNEGSFDNAEVYYLRCAYDYYL